MEKNCPSAFTEPLEFYDQESLEPLIQKIRICLQDFLLPLLESLRSAERLIQVFENDPTVIDVDAEESIVSLLILSYITLSEIPKAFDILKENESRLSTGERSVLYQRFSELEKREK